MLKTTEKIINVLPMILKRENRPIQTQELELLIEKEIPEIKNLNGEIRIGLLTGITDRHRDGVRVVPHLAIWKLSDLNYYQYED
jgi:hypothetical protein